MTVTPDFPDSPELDASTFRSSHTVPATEYDHVSRNLRPVELAFVMTIFSSFVLVFVMVPAAPVVMVAFGDW